VRRQMAKAGRRKRRARASSVMSPLMSCIYMSLFLKMLSYVCGAMASVALPALYTWCSSVSYHRAIWASRCG